MLYRKLVGLDFHLCCPQSSTFTSKMNDGESWFMCSTNTSLFVRLNWFAGIPNSYRQNDELLAADARKHGPAKSKLALFSLSKCLSLDNSDSKSN